MDILANILPIAQIVVSVILIVAILLQQRGGGLGGAFGGAGTSYHTKRGFEKIIFTTTIIFAVLFVLLSIASLLIK
jgi:preprotein translocase subunit SecG